jgi:hypothetical protein
MSDFADFFDAELASPSLTIKTAWKVPSLSSLFKTFKTETSAAGPVMAAMGVIPDAMSGVGAIKGLRQAAKEAPGAIVDAAGNTISAAEHATELKSRRKGLMGDLFAAPASAVGNIAGWMIPGSLPVKIIGGMGLPWALSGMARQAGRIVG